MVSLIIPIYNTKKYLNKCLDSVLQQSYSDLEIILVDDGSTDGSEQICDKYEKLDHRVKVIHKPNGGLSSARNEGVKNTSGEYISFLDSDDFLTKDYIKKSVDMCIKYDADISIMQMCFCSESTNEELVSDEKEKIIVLSPQEAIEQSLLQKYYSCCAPAKLYKREIVEGIDFPVGKLSEDLAVCHKFLGKAKKVVYSTTYGYYYRQHETSIMHTFNPRRLDAIKWAKEIEKYCQINFPSIISVAEGRTFNVAIHLLLDLPDKGKVHDDCYNEIWNEVKRTRVSALRCKKNRIRDKMAAILSFGGERLVKRIWNSKLAVKHEEI